MDRRTMISGGAFWMAGLVGCLIIASSASNTCHTGYWSREPDWNAGQAWLIVLELTADKQLLFDGKQIPWGALHPLFHNISKYPIQPIVVFRPAIDADCRDVVRARAMMEHSVDCENGGCAEGSEWNSYQPNAPNI